MAIKKLMENKDEIEIELKNGSLESLVEELSLKYEKEFRFFHILLNGRSCSSLPESLDTKLSEGDVVVGYFRPANGRGVAKITSIDTA